MRQKEGSDAFNNSLKRRMSAKFSDGDVKGAVRLLASDKEYAPQDDRTLARLAQKHPTAPYDLSIPLPPDDSCGPQILASEEDVLEALASYRLESVGGLDGLGLCHLRTLTASGSAEAGRRLLVSLTKVVNLVLEDGVPVFARPVSFGASLCAIVMCPGKEGRGSPPESYR